MSTSSAPMCERWSFGADDTTRWIDFRVTVTAPQGPVVFGDTKEGSFGMRVGGAMSVDDKAGGKIVNSDGLVDGEAWGKRAAWVDYSGPDRRTRSWGSRFSIIPRACGTRRTGTCGPTGCLRPTPLASTIFSASRMRMDPSRWPRGNRSRSIYRVILHAGDAADGPHCRSVRTVCR